MLAYDRVDYARDANGEVQTRWDGRTLKPSPVTGENVPNDSARVPIEVYVNPRKAAWPEADFVVGNPPFIGNKRMRLALGDGYVEALRAAWNDVPESADLVMYWWHHAAQLTRRGALKRFGLITTNSIRQAFNRKIIEAALAEPSGKSKGSEQAISLVFAIPDHPWVDTADGAAVRIAMTTGDAAGRASGRLLEVQRESEGDDGEVLVNLRETMGALQADLRCGAELSNALPLQANKGLAYMGMIPLGEGFWIDSDRAKALMDEDGPELAPHVREYRNGRDVLYAPRGIFALDFFGLDEQTLRQRFPASYQWLLERAKPARANDKRKSYRDYWWYFAEARPALRNAIADLPRYIGTTETAKHRIFVFIDSSVLPDQKVRVIALAGSESLAVLSSAVHVGWSLKTGGTLEDRPVYNGSRCFDPFPFPTPTEAQAERIRTLAEQLDAHRKRQQAAHPGLTLTGMYNVLEALREGRELSAKERGIHGEGLVSVLRQIHDELDAAVLEAYGWADLLPDLRIAHGNESAPSGDSRVEARRRFDEAVLERLVALNAERAAEEARGLIRWLRPEYQNPDHRNPTAHSASARPAHTGASANASIDAAADRATHIAAHAQAEDAQHTGTQASLLPAPADDADGEASSDEDAATDSATPSITPLKAQPWPRDTVDQIRAIADLLLAAPAPLTLDQIAAHFSSRGPWKNRLPQLIDMLLALGRAEAKDEGYVGRR